MKTSALLLINQLVRSAPDKKAKERLLLKLTRRLGLDRLLSSQLHLQEADFRRQLDVYEIVCGAQVMAPLPPSLRVAPSWWCAPAPVSGLPRTDASPKPRLVLGVCAANRAQIPGSWAEADLFHAKCARMAHELRRLRKDLQRCAAARRLQSALS